jgi:hypothetical protein
MNGCSSTRLEVKEWTDDDIDNKNKTRGHFYIAKRKLVLVQRKAGCNFNR